MNFHGFPLGIHQRTPLISHGEVLILVDTTFTTTPQSVMSLIPWHHAADLTCTPPSGPCGSLTDLPLISPPVAPCGPLWPGQAPPPLTSTETPFLDPPQRPELTLSGNVRIIERQLDELERAIRLRDWIGVDWEFNRVKRAVTKYKREELTTKEMRTWG